MLHFLLIFSFAEEWITYKMQETQRRRNEGLQFSWRGLPVMQDIGSVGSGTGMERGLLPTRSLQFDSIVIGIERPSRIRLQPVDSTEGLQLSWRGLPVMQESNCNFSFNKDIFAVPDNAGIPPQL